MAGFKRDELLIAKSQNRAVGIGAGLVAFAVAMVLAFLFSSALAGPVAQVTQAANRY